MSRLVLASASRTRAAMLERAGVPVVCDPAGVDEDAVKTLGRQAGWTVEAVADTLADRKAQDVTVRHPGALVLGADQMLDCEGTWFDKPADRAAARAQLLALRGRTHRLVSAVAVVRDGAPVWRHVDAARLTVRPFTEAFLDRYLDEVGDEVLHSVGAYQLEGAGAQLFSAVEGDFFTVLGLPLLPVLGFLRAQRILPE